MFNYAYFVLMHAAYCLFIVTMLGVYNISGSSRLYVYRKSAVKSLCVSVASPSRRDAGVHFRLNDGKDQSL